MLNLGIIDDEKQLDITLSNLLKEENYRVSKVEKKEQLNQLDGIVITMKTRHHLVSVIEWLIACKNNPYAFVWIYSKEPLEDEQMIMMSLGANEVVTETTNLPHLSIVIKNTFSRINKQSCQNKELKDDTLVNVKNQTVYVNGKEVELTKKEFQLFSILYENINVTVSYEELLNKIWLNNKTANFYVLANLVFHLREKVRGSDQFEIKTTRSKGYMIAHKLKEKTLNYKY